MSPAAVAVRDSGQGRPDRRLPEDRQGPRQFRLNVAEYAIDSVIETVRSATESLAQNKRLALKTEVAKSLPIGLGDEQRLTQVLLNLVGNAIKFTDAGEVRVTAKVVNGHFAVSVADTGPGIPEQEQTRIFDQFHQLDSSLKVPQSSAHLLAAFRRSLHDTGYAEGRNVRIEFRWALGQSDQLSALAADLVGPWRWGNRSEGWRRHRRIACGEGSHHENSYRVHERDTLF
jgi:anti-sigma regulatory factor (Ser/Thr protein kinase)